MLGMSLRDQITELVEALIIDRGLEPGDKLPSEREMCEMWGLNRMTLRNALKRLADYGVVESKVGLGTFVAEPKMVRNLQDTKGFSQAVTEAGHVPSRRVIYSDLAEANKFVVRHLRVMLASPVLILKRVNLLDGSPVSVETSWINARNCEGIEKHDFSVESVYQTLENVYGIVPTMGSEKIDVTKIDDDEAELLGVEVGASAYFQSGLIQDQDGKPLEYFKCVVLPEHLTFATEMRSVERPKRTR